ncbi:MAG: aspartate-semialdehyde dehydrogenase [bacterium]
MSKNFNVAVVGVTGAVGQEMLKALERRKFPVKNILPLASSRSVGKKIIFQGKESLVQELTEDSFKGVDIALFSAGAERSKIFAPIAAKAGAVVIDNSSAFRMEKDVPLIVPEVNPHMIKKHNGIIANPNCSTIQMVVALKPIHDKAKIKRIVATTFQAVSGTGTKAIIELLEQTKALFNKGKYPPKVYPHQIAFNCLPHIDVFMPNGYTKEEMKMVDETKKIMEDDSIRVTATTVRVPVFRSHSESVNIETEKKLTKEETQNILRNAPGIIVEDDPSKNIYPLAINAEDKYEVFVGRIREDESIPNGLNMWIVSDNLLKGAASNAVQIAELLADNLFHGD